MAILFKIGIDIEQYKSLFKLLSFGVGSAIEMQCNGICIAMHYS